MTSNQAGRPPHEPTEKSRAEVSALYSYGIPIEEIAAYIGITAKTLDKHYRQELDIAKAKSHAAVGKFLFKAASGESIKDGATHSDCIRAAMFWAKTQMGFREIGERIVDTDSNLEIVITRAKKPDAS